jgi:4-amino-4-deoxy-L-arabinose transferase-like glycosyltransferase
MRVLREHGVLFLILVPFLALGVLYLQVTPLLETPDEPSHFHLVKYIADEVRLPPARSAPADAGPVPVIHAGPPVYYQPPLYYVLGAPIIAGLDTDGFAQGVVPNPNWARGWAPTPGRSPDNKHIYVLTADQRPPNAGWATAMKRLRVFSLLLGAATVVGAYALARTIWRLPDQRAFVLVVTALVAFNPAFLFVTIGVTNDALLFALSTWAFVLMALLVAGGSEDNSALRGWARVASLGVVLGLAALTKQSALALLPVAALAVLWGAQSQPRPRRTALVWLVLLAGLVALVAGWWYLTNGLNYGDPLGFRPHQTPQVDWQPTPAEIVRQVGRALRGYWAIFGWGLIEVDPVVYIIVALFALLGLLGLVVSLLTGRLRHGSVTERRVVAALGLGVALNFAGLVLWLWRTSAPYGRLLFPTLGPVAVLLVLGWRQLLGDRYRWAFAGVVILATGLFAFLVPWRYLQPAYVDPVVSPSTVAGATSLDVRFDDTLELLGYELAPQSAQPGDSVALTLYWRAAARLESLLTAFVQVAPRDPQQQVASADDYVGGSYYPSPMWQPGEMIRQDYDVQLAKDVPAPALYWFTVGLYGESGGERLSVRADGADVPGRAVRLGPLRVLGQDDVQPSQEVDYRLGPSIRLVGYDVGLPDPSASGGETRDVMTITLYWEATAAPEGDYVVFVHLLDGEGNLVAQHDELPREGDFPTWAWRAGDHVPDLHSLSLPSELKPGAYRLQVGMYLRGGETRLPVLDAAGQRLSDDVVVLTEFDLSAGGAPRGD